MPKGVEGAYRSDYVTRSVKQGDFNEANEAALHRYPLDKDVMGANSGAFQQTQDSPSLKTNHRNAAGKIEGKVVQGEHG
jgi:hypothetical protein